MLLYSMISYNFKSNYREIVECEHYQMAHPEYDCVIPLLNSNYTVTSYMLASKIYTNSIDTMRWHLINGTIEAIHNAKSLKIYIFSGMYVYVVLFFVITMFIGIREIARVYKNALLILSLLPMAAIQQIAAIKQFILNRILR